MAVVRRDFRGRRTETRDTAAENAARASDTTKQLTPILNCDDGDSVRYIIDGTCENYDTS
jgi:hypothetical protein